MANKGPVPERAGSIAICHDGEKIWLLAAELKWTKEFRFLPVYLALPEHRGSAHNPTPTLAGPRWNKKTQIHYQWRFLKQSLQTHTTTRVNGSHDGCNKDFNKYSFCTWYSQGRLIGEEIHRIPGVDGSCLMHLMQICVFLFHRGQPLHEKIPKETFQAVALLQLFKQLFCSCVIAAGMCLPSL